MYAPRPPKLSLERMGWPAMKGVRSNKNLNQHVLLWWVREPIAAYDTGQFQS